MMILVYKILQLAIPIYICIKLIFKKSCSGSPCLGLTLHTYFLFSPIALDQSPHTYLVAAYIPQMCFPAHIHSKFALIYSFIANSNAMDLSLFTIYYKVLMFIWRGSLNIIPGDLSLWLLINSLIRFFVTFQVIPVTIYFTYYSSFSQKALWCCISVNTVSQAC